MENLVTDVYSPKRPSSAGPSGRAGSPFSSPRSNPSRSGTPTGRLSVAFGRSTANSPAAPTPGNSTAAPQQYQGAGNSSTTPVRKSGAAGGLALSSSRDGRRVLPTTYRPSISAYSQRTSTHNGQEKEPRGSAGYHSHSPKRHLSEFETAEMLVEEALSSRKRAEDAEVALEAERRLCRRVQEELDAEISHARAATEKLEEMTKLVAVSTSLAERAENDCDVAAKETERLHQQLQAAKERLATLTQQNEKLESDLTLAKCEASDARSELLRVKDELTEENATLKRDKEQATRARDELKAELLTTHKKHEASLELVKAQQLQQRQELEVRIDELKGQIADLSASLEEAVTQCETGRFQVRALEEDIRLNSERFQARIHELEALHAIQIEGLSKKMTQYRNNEGTLEHHIDVLLSRTTALQATIEANQVAMAKQRAEIEHQKELNHVLAVKLKAALADREASEMEAETRKILTKQNEEMERQLQELRRTIAELMSRR